MRILSNCRLNLNYQIYVEVIVAIECLILLSEFLGLVENNYLKVQCWQQQLLARRSKNTLMLIIGTCWWLLNSDTEIADRHYVTSMLWAADFGCLFVFFIKNVDKSKLVKKREAMRLNMRSSIWYAIRGAEPKNLIGTGFWQLLWRKKNNLRVRINDKWM